jgi:hypothetical protein
MKLGTLLKRKQDLLLLEEKHWRLKSREVWLKEGDNNTKFFHRYAQYRKAQNIINEIKGMDETFVSSHKEMVEAGFDFFSSLFKEKPGCPIEEILKVVDLFPTKILKI